MKKLIFALTLLAVPFIAQAANDSAKNVIEFVKILKTQKADWLKHEEDLHEAKYELLIAEHNKMFDNKIKHIEEFANNPTAAFDQAMLKNLIASHKETMQEWHDLCESFQEKAKSLYERQMKEIAQFEISKGLAEMPTEEEEVTEIEVAE